jgi:hypothetical protein
MSKRDDFNSAMRSPGSYSPASNYGGNNMAGRMGGNSGTFGGTQQFGNGYQMASQVPPAIAQAMARNNKPGYAGGEVMQGPIPPALGPQGVPQVDPVVAALANRVKLPPGLTSAAQYANPFRWPTARRNDMAVTNNGLPYNNGYNGRPAANSPPNPNGAWTNAYGGYRQQAMGYPGQQGTSNWNSNTTNIRPTGGVIKDQSRVPSSQYKGFNNPW